MSNENSQMKLTDVAIVDRDALEVPGIFNASDESWIARLEQTAKNAPKVIEYFNKILVNIAHAGDWVTHNGKTASLSSAGAERYLKFFPMQFVDWDREKQEWTDEIGNAYRWIYRCICIFNGTQLLVEGKFSTRDKLLGFKNNEYRPLEEIDESDIMSAARHMCIGEGIKAHLGLRAIPVETLKQLSVKVEDVNSVGYQQGSRGGTPEASDDEQKTQMKLQKMCIALGNGDPETAMSILEEVSSFTGKDGKIVKGKTMTKFLTGKRLEITFGNVKERYVRSFGQEHYDADIEG